MKPFDRDSRFRSFLILGLCCGIVSAAQEPTIEKLTASFSAKVLGSAAALSGQDVGEAQGKDQRPESQKVERGTEDTSDSSTPRVITIGPLRGRSNLYNPDLPPEEDPLRQKIDIYFRDMDLANVVALLAQKGKINIVMDVPLKGKVTASMKDVPLGEALESILRVNGYGIVRENGLLRGFRSSKASVEPKTDRGTARAHDPPRVR